MEEVKFNDGHWDEALKVLKREERKAWLRSLLPWILWGASAVVVFALLLVPADHESPQLVDESAKTQQIEKQAVEMDEVEPDASSGNQNSTDLLEENSATSAPVQIESATPVETADADEKKEDVAQQAKTLGEIEYTPGPVVSAEKVAASSDKEPEGKKVAEQSLSDQDTKGNLTKGAVEHAPITVDKSAASDFADDSPDSEEVANSMLSVNHQPKSDSKKFKVDSRQMPRLSFNVQTVKTGPSLKYGDYDYTRLFPRKADHKFILGGQSFLAGFGSKSGETFFNPEIGLGYEKVFGAHFSASAAVSYFQISGIQHVAEYSQTTLDFGFNTTLTQIRTNKLHFAYLPIQANWDFTRRSSLTGGIGVSYLINGLSLVTVSEIDNFSNTEVDRYEDWGYVGGYKSINASLLAGYEFRITPDWTFGLQYQYGLTEITKQEVYGISREDRNSRLRATLKYSIWR